jgi:hypothetical protein
MKTDPECPVYSVSISALSNFRHFARPMEPVC